MKQSLFLKKRHKNRCQLSVSLLFSNLISKGLGKLCVEKSLFSKVFLPFKATQVNQWGDRGSKNLAVISNGLGFIKGFLSVIVVSILSISCSKKDKDVTFELVPERPVVIDSPLTTVDGVTGQKKVFEAPWYTFSIKITNNSSSKITFVGLKAVITAYVDGELKTSEVKFDPGEDNGTSWYFGVINANGGVYNTSGWIIGNLPKSDSFSYGVSLEMTGWYGDYATPEKRFSATFFHTTQ